MADEDITLDGQPLHSLRVADLKAALEQRNLPKSGQKNTLIKRLKGALMLENLQKSSTSHSGLQPNSQIGEEMSQNSFIKQYLAKQQELLRQRLEREALQQDAERPVVLDDDDDQSEDNDGSSYGKHQSMPSQLPLSRTEERAGGELMMGHGLMTRRPDMGVGPPLHPQEVPEAPGARMLRAAFHHGHKEPPAPSPPRAVASLSVRVLGQPDHQGLPPTVPRAQEKEGTAPTEPGSAHPVLHLSRSAGIAAGDCIHVDSDDDDDDDDDDEWGPGPGGARKGNRAPPQPPQVPVVVPSARSKRKLQPPQHIPPPQAHHSPMQLRHPTPPPSPPPNLFPLPDTPKQSPPDTDEKEGESSGPRGPSVPPPAMQRQDSASSSRSSSPEPPVKRGPGPLSLLVHKMESEGAGTAKPGASTGESPLLKLERKRLQENQEKEEKREKQQPEKEERRKATQAADKNQMDSGSSSDSDSRSDSSSPSSQSSSSAKQLQKVDQGHEAHSEKKNLRKGVERGSLPKGEVSEPSAAAVTEAELDSESSMAQQPASGAEPVNSESHLEESTTPKAFSARKISLTGSKTSPTATEAAAAEAEAGAAAGRKRRWGSSTAVTAKKPSISITTDSLKSLIPDIKVAQEAVVELHPEELQLSGDEESLDSTRGDQDKGLKIRRTVTQVVPTDGQENGQGNEEEEEEEEKMEQEKQHRTSTEKRKSLSEDAAETQTPAVLDGEAKKVTPSDSLVRRSISQQKSGVSITIDDPIRTSKPPSPPRGKLSNIIHVTNLVRPFTLGQLKELLNQTGSVVEDGFWIDKIKSHCYVTYATTEEAAATRAALHGVKWPQSNPKVLSVDFCEQDELDFHKGIIKPEREEDHAPPPMVPQTRLPPLMPERDRDRERDRERERERGAAVAAAAGVRDLWAEREREMQRRERARGEREWDRDKVREFARPGDDERRSRSRDRERRRRERPKSKERKTDRKEKGEELPAKLLDDLFLKTKAAPCIYWLPLTEEQATQRLLERTERQKERQRRLKEQKDEEDKKRDEEKKERPKGREKDGGGVLPAAAAAAGIRGAGRGADPDRDRERARDRDGDKRRDGGHRPGRPLMGGGGGGGRRSRSRSDTRDRRR